MEILSPKKEEKKERKKLLRRHDYQEDLLKRDADKKRRNFITLFIFQITWMTQHANHHHSHYLPWQILPDTVNHSRPGHVTGSHQYSGAGKSLVFIYTYLLYICKSWGCTCSQLLLVCLQIQRAIARDRESFSALLFLSNSLCKMTRDFH